MSVDLNDLAPTCPGQMDRFFDSEYIGFKKTPHALPH